MHDESDDDWLSSPTQGGAMDPLASQEYTRIASRYSDAGYREGITDGKLATLQSGFDQGFALSVPLSRQIGILRGRAAALLSFSTSSNKTQLKATSIDNEDIEELREYIRELSKIRRDDILPVDLERIQHEREAHDGEGYELDNNENRDMEFLEKGLESINGGNNESKEKEKKSGEELITELDRKLYQLQSKIIAGI